MRVALDLQPALAAPTGVGRYARSLARYLPPLAPADRFVGLAFGRGTAGDISAPNFLMRRFGLLPGRGMSLLWRTIGWPPADLFTGRVDLFHFTSFVARPVRRARVVATIHDCAFRRLPDCSEPRNAAFLAAHVPRTLERARLVLADSAFTAREITALYGYPAERIRVTPLGVDGRFRRRPAAEVEEARRRHGLPPAYILCVATIEPRKNIRTLLRAYALLREGGPAVPKLVLVGPDGWRDEGMKVEGAIDALGLRGEVIRRAYMPHTELPAVYSGSSLFVFPALYEGFGLPPLEAMACGVPVVCSDAASLPEVVGDAAVTVPPLDAERLAAAVRDLLGDAARRERMAARGLERARRFTWNETARRTLAAYRECLEA
ncbi:MAG: glycosyltransferase family 1 protein [bacterium]|nr:glycosyltransferase family 1 protein [bacterium]